jgi:hypothetical protein
MCNYSFKIMIHHEISITIWYKKSLTHLSLRLPHRRRLDQMVPCLPAAGLDGRLLHPLHPVYWIPSGTRGRPDDPAGGANGGGGADLISTGSAAATTASGGSASASSLPPKRFSLPPMSSLPHLLSSTWLTTLASRWPGSLPTDGPLQLAPIRVHHPRLPLRCDAPFSRIMVRLADKRRSLSVYA